MRPWCLVQGKIFFWILNLRTRHQGLIWIKTKEYLNDVLNKVYRVSQSLRSASKLLRHSYPLESISSSVRKWPPPPHPGDNVVFFCFLRALSTAVQHWLGWEREGYPGNVLFGQVFFANNECVVASVLCWHWTVSTNFVADCCSIRSSGDENVFGHIRAESRLFRAPSRLQLRFPFCC